MSKAIDDLTAAVTEETTVVDSAITLLKGLSDRIAATSEDPKVQALANEVKAQADKLAAAVTANTPATPPATTTAPTTPAQPADPNATSNNPAATP